MSKYSNISGISPKTIQKIYFEESKDISEIEEWHDKNFINERVGHLGHPQLKNCIILKLMRILTKILITMKDLRSMKFYQTCYYLKKSEKE